MNAETRISASAETKEDLYYGIHKGIRLGNARMLVALGQVDPADDAQVTETLARLYDLIGLGIGHLTHENSEIHTALEARVPGAADHAADDHAGHENAFDELRILAEDVAVAGMDRPAKLRRLYQRFALFMADDLEHMHEEETVIQPLMEANFSNDELVAIHDRIVGAIPPEKMLRYMRLILPAASRPERIAMIGGMQVNMPSDVFAAFMADVVGSPWSFGDWDALEAALC